MQEKVTYCALKDRMIDECKCRYDPKKCWYFFKIPEKELKYLEEVYRK